LTFFSTCVGNAKREAVAMIDGYCFSLCYIDFFTSLLENTIAALGKWTWTSLASIYSKVTTKIKKELPDVTPTEVKLELVQENGVDLLKYGIQLYYCCQG
jgi:hypothetical protein